jgi:hypothetical protein
MSEEIKQFVGDFLVEQAKPEMTMQEKLDLSINQRDRAVGICDGMMAWETPAQARKSAKDLSALKKEIQNNG